MHQTLAIIGLMVCVVTTVEGQSKLPRQCPLPPQGPTTIAIANPPPGVGWQWDEENDKWWRWKVQPTAVQAATYYPPPVMYQLPTWTTPTIRGINCGPSG